MASASRDLGSCDNDADTILAVLRSSILGGWVETLTTLGMSGNTAVMANWPWLGLVGGVTAAGGLEEGK